jgi:hypothetical protein
MLPESCFGTGKAPLIRLRKSVLAAIALFADSDGTKAFPGVKTLADICLVSDRTIRTTQAWLVANDLLKMSVHTSIYLTNEYTVCVPKDVVSIRKHGRKTPRSLDTNPEVCDPQPGSLEGNAEVWSTQPGSLEASTPPKLPTTALPPLSDRPLKPPTHTAHKHVGERDSSKGTDIRNFTAEASTLASELNTLSDGDARFENRHKKALAILLPKYSAEELKSDFSKYYDAIDKENRYAMSNLARIFCETTVDSMNATRSKNERMAAERKAIERKAVQMQAEAEAERVEARAKREKEEALIENELGD